MTQEFTDLNEREKAVLKGCVDEVKSNSGLFPSCMVHVDGLSTKQINGYFSSLIKKGYVVSLGREGYNDMCISDKVLTTYGS